MMFISHRGNLNGRSSEFENSPSFIENAISCGFHVEVDLWSFNNMFWLGHDNPTYLIQNEFLLKHIDALICHAKSPETLIALRTLNRAIHCFYHDDPSPVTLTSRGYIWSAPGQQYSSHSILCVNDPYTYNYDLNTIIAGIFSDNIATIEQMSNRG